MLDGFAWTDEALHSTKPGGCNHPRDWDNCFGLRHLLLWRCPEKSTDEPDFARSFHHLWVHCGWCRIFKLRSQSCKYKWQISTRIRLIVRHLGNPSARSDCRNRHWPHDLRLPNSLGLHCLWRRLVRNSNHLLDRQHHRSAFLPQRIFPLLNGLRRCWSLLHIHRLWHTAHDGRRSQVQHFARRICLRRFESLLGKFHTTS